MTDPQNVHVPERTVGISPKVIAGAITGLIVFALTKLAVPVDPIVEQAINALAIVAASYLAPPAAVAIPGPVGPPSDALLGDHVLQQLDQDDPPA